MKVKISRDLYNEVKTYAEELIQLADRGLTELAELRIHRTRVEMLVERIKEGRVKLDETKEVVTKLAENHMESLFHIQVYLLRALGFMMEYFKRILCSAGHFETFEKFRNSIAKKLSV